MEAQELKPIGFPQAILKPGVKKAPTNNKTYGTVLYSEDFDSTGNAARNGLPLGWTSTTGDGSSNIWIWSNTAPGGQYSSSAGPLQSTTGSNGYLLLPSDLYNTPIGLGGIPMDAMVTSSAITIPTKSTVRVRFEQHYRYCCSSSNELVVEVSNDNINWTAFDVTQGRSFNVPNMNAEKMEIDVSGVLANQTTAYVRFRQTGASHFYFMVDDLELIEGYDDGLELTDFNVIPQDNFQLKPIHTMSPYCLMPPLSFQGVGKNVGANSQSNANMQVSVYHDSSITGGTLSGLGLRYQESDTIGNLMLPQDVDTFTVDNPSFHFIGIEGYYRFHSELKSDSVNQVAANADLDFSFFASDTVMARDNGTFTGGTGPSDFVGGGNDGDKWGVLYSLWGNSPNVTTISFFVANVTNNIGAALQPRIWAFDGTKSTLDSSISNMPVGSSPFTSTVNASMLGQWISLPLFPPVTLSGNAQYVVGWEQKNINSTNSFKAGRDLSMEPSVPLTNFVSVGNPAQWGWVSQVAGVRLNSGYTLQGYPCNYHTSIDDNQIVNSLTIYPNPNAGQFAIRLKAEKATQYTLKVRNNLGQIVLEEQVTANGNFAKSIDLSQSESGIYFLSLENGAERYVEKIVVQ
jgi:hypothetical protein